MGAGPTVGLLPNALEQTLSLYTGPVRVTTAFYRLAGVETDLGEVTSPACSVESGWAVWAASSVAPQIWGLDGMLYGPLLSQ